ncbi:hypothetical protein V5O48_008749 [Marasmius crinis-equi]|uniref:Uncharacterized protein n=1 Tax=Marasmius crinis-equi TaxID=585013 RepID=A0ABR3FD29_9AGAR
MPTVQQTASSAAKPKGGRRPPRNLKTFSPTWSNDPSIPPTPSPALIQDPVLGSGASTTALIQTRSRNQNLHPGLAHNTYTVQRRSSSEVQADRERQEKEVQSARADQQRRENLLAAYTESAHNNTLEYQSNFAHPALVTPVRVGVGKFTASIPPKTTGSKEAQIIELQRQLDALRGSEEEIFQPVEPKTLESKGHVSGSEKNPEENDSVERLSEEEARVNPEAVNSAKPTSARPRGGTSTTRPTAPSSTPSEKLRPAAAQNSKAKKRKSDANGDNSSNAKKPKTENTPKTTISSTEGGLKKNRGKKKKNKEEDGNDSALQEGKSAGFDDNRDLAIQERQQSKTDDQAMVKIKAEGPIKLPTGRAARGEHENKFTSKHLPDFIKANSGDRKLFTPLCKEAMGFVPSWSVLTKELIEGVVERGWGPNMVILSESGKDAVSTVANTKASDLRHELGSGAVNIVTKFIQENWSNSPPPLNPDDEDQWVFRSEADVAEWAQWQTTKFVVDKGPRLSPFHFADFMGNPETGEVTERKGMFENDLLLQVMAIYYAHVNALPPTTRMSGYPAGILELAIQALHHSNEQSQLERALTCYTSGNVPSRPAKEFSHTAWGNQEAVDCKGVVKHKDNEFRKTIKTLSAAKWDVIKTKALAYVKPKRGTKLPRKKKGEVSMEIGEAPGDSDDDVMMSDPPEPLQGIDGVVQVTNNSGESPETTQQTTVPVIIAAPAPENTIIEQGERLDGAGNDEGFGEEDCRNGGEGSGQDDDDDDGESESDEEAVGDKE